MMAFDLLAIQTTQNKFIYLCILYIIYDNIKIVTYLYQFIRQNHMFMMINDFNLKNFNAFDTFDSFDEQDVLDVFDAFNAI